MQKKEKIGKALVKIPINVREKLIFIREKDTRHKVKSKDIKNYYI